MKILCIIPARGGSKGIPQKNIKPLLGKPLIAWSIETALAIPEITDVVVSTDSEAIAKVALEYGAQVPFLRPAELANDTASMDDVLLHTLEYYRVQSIEFDVLLLLQATSPFRQAKHIQEALALFSKEVDMVTSVKEADANPYYLLVEENEAGFLEKSKKPALPITRRQDIPKVYQYNGAIYVINIASFYHYRRLDLFNKVIKYEMPTVHSVDIDTPLDWDYAEFLLEKQYITLQ